MSKLFDHEIEIKAVVSLVDATSDVQSFLISKLRYDHFDLDLTHAAFNRITELLSQGNAIPTSKVFKSDAALNEETKNLFQGELTPVDSTSDAQALIDTLEIYRQKRVLAISAKESTAILKRDETTPESINQARMVFEQALLNSRSIVTEAPILHAGQGRNSDEVTKEILSLELTGRVKVGFKAFDDASGGFAKTSFVVIGANTGAGKSSMCVTLRDQMYLKNSSNVLVVGLEMSEVEYQERHLSFISRVPYDKIVLRQLSLAQKQKIQAAEERFQEYGKKNNCRASFWCPSDPLTMQQISEVTRPMGYDVVIIDYLGLVSGMEDKQLWERLGDMSKYGKQMAKRNQQVVIAMVQLDEETLQVKYAKAIRHHASYVWKWFYGEKEEETGRIELIQEKTRFCKRFNFPLIANLDYCTFSDPTDSVTEYNQPENSTQSQPGLHAQRSMVSLEGDDL